MLGLSMLPAVHVHDSVSGQTVAHRHVVDEASDHDDALAHTGSSLDHGDHHAAKTLEPTFVAERPFDLDHPVVTVRVVLAELDRRVVGQVDPPDGVMTHGPPIRVDSLRAPPA